MARTGFTYDAGALIAADRGEKRIRDIHEWLLRRRVTPTVPAPVLAQAWRGGPQPMLARLLAGCIIERMDETAARVAGRLCGLAGTADIVDAVVVESAVRRGDAIVTSDPGDIRVLAAALDVEVTILTT